MQHLCHLYTAIYIAMSRYTSEAKADHTLNRRFTFTADEVWLALEEIYRTSLSLVLSYRVHRYVKYEVFSAGISSRIVVSKLLMVSCNV